MEQEIKTWLENIDNAINEINMFLPDKRDFLAFQRDIKTRRAIERNIEIIGEAMNRILHVAPEISISNARKIVNTRNRIIHGYDTVSDDILWSIVIKYLPILDREIKALISER
jgi:uncharacterized protein with HEPN domain